MEQLATLIKTLNDCSAALDAFVAAQPEIARIRKRSLDDLKSETNERAAADLKRTLGYDIQSAMEVGRCLAHLEECKKNAEGALQRLEVQARKDLDTISSGSSDAANAAIKMHGLCQDLAASLTPVVQKAKFSQMDVKNLLGHLQQERNFSTRAVAGEVARSVANIQELLQTISHDLTAMSDGVKAFRA